MIRVNVISGMVCLGFGMFLWWIAADVPSFTATDELGGRFFPQLIAAMIIIASIGLVVTGWMGIEISGGQVGGKKGQSQQKSTAEEKHAEPVESTTVLGMPVGTFRLSAFLLVMLVYTLILELIGYIPASLVTFAAMIWIAGEHRIPRVVIGSVVITALLYTLFAVIFGMNVPEASLF